MSQKRIAIIGAGPVGIEAALYGVRLGHQVSVLDQSHAGASVAAWSFVRMFSPWSELITPLGLEAIDGTSAGPLPRDECPTGDQFRQRYLVPIARSRAMAGVVRERLRVISVKRGLAGEADPSSPSRDTVLSLLLRDPSGRIHTLAADFVLDCSGTYQHHRWAGRGGIPAPGEKAFESRLHYAIPDVIGAHRGRFAGRHALLLGRGPSAALALSALATLAAEAPGTHVTWCPRRAADLLAPAGEDPLAARRELVARMLRLASEPPSWLTVYDDAALERISNGERLRVTLNRDTGLIELDVDEVVALVGYSPDNTILENLHFRIESRPIDAEQVAVESDSHRPAADFRILGAKSYGTSEHFTLAAGHRQIRDVYCFIQDDPRLDLYS